MSRRRAAASLVPVVIALAACGPTTTTIAEIKGDPPTYDGQTVMIDGVVKSRLSIIVWKTYVVDDGTGEITVVTEKALPNVGARVQATGRIEDAFSLGSNQRLVLVDESAQ